jgi:hypothetical protein
LFCVGAVIHAVETFTLPTATEPKKKMMLGELVIIAPANLTRSTPGQNGHGQAPKAMLGQNGHGLPPVAAEPEPGAAAETKEAAKEEESKAEEKPEEQGERESIQIQAGNPESKRVLVKNLAEALSVEHIRPAFAEFGDIVTIEESSPGSCIIEFASKSAAVTARAAMNGCPLAGQELQVGYLAPANVPGEPVQQEEETKKEEKEEKKEAAVPEDPFAALGDDPFASAAPAATTADPFASLDAASFPPAETQPAADKAKEADAPSKTGTEDDDSSSSG